ncbi:hypothetical protein G9G63_09650 [Paenibacillus sp. EKM202P]|uniref:hypothetical protein n=1 Tax=unclassified Paenibacillus TaxID=185978 RepID=UPI0013E9F620|nr:MULTISPECIES: hypothetical protein [unclassified Paenibacillus]KAF6565411.1 hypothetical protein G9G63_09650 [Paenibacillus sp. EKM202P]KAF6569264.1 hypothetical protein G9G64_12445 [Paenibacillus sp. EKM207P]
MSRIIEINGKHIYYLRKFDRAIPPNEVEVTFDLGRLELFRSSGEIELKYSKWKKPSFLDFTYFQDELIIEEIHSRIRRIGHGRIMLEFLLELIHIYNAKVEEYNKNSTEVKFDRITKVTGYMREGGGITHEELKLFYDKCGFLKNNQLLKEIK